MVNFTSRVGGDICIGRNVWISFAVSGGCYIQGWNGIKIGDDTIFAPGVKIISANHSNNDFSCWEAAPPICIGKKCWIGANVVILPSVTLGDDCIVGAGSVVKDSFPNRSIIAGVPAKLVTTIGGN
jgi:acetyltransferase-like isoleucine patch superfamily enzyme